MTKLVRVSRSHVPMRTSDMAKDESGAYRRVFVEAHILDDNSLAMTEDRVLWVPKRTHFVAAIDTLPVELEVVEMLQRRWKFDGEEGVVEVETFGPEQPGSRRVVREPQLLHVYQDRIAYVSFEHFPCHGKEMKSFKLVGMSEDLRVWRESVTWRRMEPSDDTGHKSGTIRLLSLWENGCIDELHVDVEPEDMAGIPLQ